MTSIDRLVGTVREGLDYLWGDEAKENSAYAALDELAALARETTEAYEGQAEFGAQQMQRAEAAEARVSELEAALRQVSDARFHNIPGVNPDGSVSSSSMAETLARAALAADRTEEGKP